MRIETRWIVLCAISLGLLAAEARADRVKIQSQAASRGDKIERRVSIRAAIRLMKHPSQRATLRSMSLENALRAMVSPLHYGTGPDYAEFRRVVGAAAVGKRQLEEKRVPGTRRDMAQLYRASVRYGLADVIDMEQSMKGSERRGLSTKVLAKDARRLLPRVDSFLGELHEGSLLKTEKALLKEAQKARNAMAARAASE